MEYKIITPEDQKYPKKLKERLGAECPPKIYYYGPLEFLDNFTMAVISADSIGGVAMMSANQLLFTIREYAMNYIGPWQSVMETEIFRLGLWKKCHNTVTLFSAKGLSVESYESFLLDRFYPPMDKFPEREEYFRRAKDGELLMLSIVEPDLTRQLRKNIIERNWIACNLADIVFVPYGIKGSKTYTVAKKVLKSNIPIFTTDSDENKDLHQLGIPGFSRKTVRKLLDEKGAKLADMIYETHNLNQETVTLDEKVNIRKPSQLEFDFVRDKSKHN